MISAALRCAASRRAAFIFYIQCTTLALMLAIRNAHTLDGKRRKDKGFYMSVTALLDVVENKSSDKVSDYRKIQMELGKQLHSYIENFYNDSLVSSAPLSKEYVQFRSFAEYAKNELGMKPYRAEWSTYSDYYHLSGTIDMVFTDNDKNYYIYDWKRMEEMSKKCLNRYTAQINLYRIILENNYNIKIHHMFLVLFHPKNDTYDITCVENRNMRHVLLVGLDQYDKRHTQIPKVTEKEKEKEK